LANRPTFSSNRPADDAKLIAEGDAEKMLKVGVGDGQRDTRRSVPERAPSSKCLALARLPQGVLNSLRMPRNYRKQNPRGAIGPRPSLLPVP
jgi:hypothetical protein